MKYLEVLCDSFKVPGFLKMAGLALVVGVGLTACDKDEEVVPVEEKAVVGALNLLADGTAVNVHLDDQKVNTNPVEGGQIGYYTVDAGQADVSVFANGETDTLASVDYSFMSQERYTAVIFGHTEEAQVLITKDDGGAPATGKAKVRFVNFLPEDASMELWVEGADEALQADVAFKAVPSFIEVDPAADMTLQVRATGSEVVLAELAEVAWVAGKTYTVFLSEQVGEDGETVVMGMVTNM